MRWRHSTLYRIISFAYRAQLRKGFKRSSLCFEVFRRKVKAIADQVCYNIVYVTNEVFLSFIHTSKHKATISTETYIFVVI